MTIPPSLVTYDFVQSLYDSWDSISKHYQAERAARQQQLIHDMPRYIREIKPCYSTSQSMDSNIYLRTRIQNIHQGNEQHHPQQEFVLNIGQGTKQSKSVAGDDDSYYAPDSQLAKKPVQPISNHRKTQSDQKYQDRGQIFISSKLSFSKVLENPLEQSDQDIKKSRLRRSMGSNQPIPRDFGITEQPYHEHAQGGETHNLPTNTEEMVNSSINRSDKNTPRVTKQDINMLAHESKKLVDPMKKSNISSKSNKIISHTTPDKSLDNKARESASKHRPTVNTTDTKSQGDPKSSTPLVKHSSSKNIKK